jgi:hypothetical protein
MGRQIQLSILPADANALVEAIRLWEPVDVATRRGNSGDPESLASLPNFRTYLLRRRPGCKFSQLDSPPRLYLCLRFTGSLAVAAQDSGPSGSLVLSRKNFAFSASCRFIPAHKYRHIAH